MDALSAVVAFIYQYLDTIAVLGLSAIGLIIIFSMMGVINMAHGEMMMIGAYATSFSYYEAALPIPLAVLLGGIAAGLAGILIERLIIRRFYGRLLASLVATWGLSLILSQAALLVLGPQIRSVPTPFGSFAVGEQSFAVYRLVMFASALLLIAAIWLLFSYTSFGVKARGTMERPEMARALGVNTERVYAVTFGIGTFLGGIAGGLFALTASIGPFIGQNYTAQAFITVVVGGAADIFTGLLSSVLTLGFVKTLFTNQFNILIGHVAMLVMALLIIRLMPAGISDWIERRRQRGHER